MSSAPSSSSTASRPHSSPLHLVPPAYFQVTDIKEEQRLKTSTPSQPADICTVHAAMDGGAATPLAPLAPSSARGVVGIFWDIENCQVPSGRSAAAVAECVRALPDVTSRAEMEFLVVCDVTKQQDGVVDDLNATQVNIHHVTSGRKKNAADEKLRQAMKRFVDTHVGLRSEADVAVVLISGDQDFLPDLSDFRRRRGVRVVLLHNRLTVDIFKKVADRTYDFHGLLTDIPARAAVASAAPVQYTELLVSNLPTSRELGGVSVGAKLEEIVKSCSGKVRHLSDSDRTAVLKFATGDKAGRALTCLQGEYLGSRELGVDFNKRPNFVAGKEDQLQIHEELQNPSSAVERRSEAFSRRTQSRSPVSLGARPKVDQRANRAGKPVAKVKAVNADQHLSEQQRASLPAVGPTRSFHPVLLPQAEGSAFTPVGGGGGGGRRPHQQQPRLSPSDASRGLVRHQRGPSPGLELRRLPEEDRTVRNLRSAAGRFGEIKNEVEPRHAAAAVESSSDEVGDGGTNRAHRHSERPRRRRRRRESQGSRDRNSSCDSAAASALARMSIQERPRNRPAAAEVSRPDVDDSGLLSVPDASSETTALLITGIVAGTVAREEVEADLRAIVADKKLDVSVMHAIRVGPSKFECHVEASDAQSALKIVSQLDGIPYGHDGKVKVDLAPQGTLLGARVVSVLKECFSGSRTRDVPWGELRGRYLKWFEDEITTPEVRKLQQVKLTAQAFGGEVLVGLLEDDDSLISSHGDGNDTAPTVRGAVSKTMSYYDSSSCSNSATPSSPQVANAAPRGRKTSVRSVSSTSPAAAAAAPVPDPGLCPLHDKRAEAGPDYVLPCVQISMDNLRTRLSRAFEGHDSAIPKKSLLHCINSTAEQVDLVARVAGPKEGGVPLEQLVDSLETTNVSEYWSSGSAGAGDDFVRPLEKIKESAKKSDELTKLEKELSKELLSVLEVVPFHRLEIASLRDKYYDVTDKNLDESCRPFGGLRTVLKLTSDTFRVIGSGRRATLVLSPSLQRSRFMLVARKVLAGLDRQHRAFSFSDPAAFSVLHQKHLRKTFRLSEYGFCYFSDLLHAVCARTKQDILTLNDGRVVLSKSVETFVERSAAILEAIDGNTCTVDRFDKSFVATYGNYSVPSLGYPSIAALFKEFSREFQVSEEVEILNGARKRLLLSLSPKRRLTEFNKCLEKTLTDQQENFIWIEKLADHLLLEQGRDLAEILRRLPAKDVKEAVEKLTVLTRVSRVEVRDVRIVLSTPEFWSRLEKRALALLFRSRPEGGALDIAGEFVPGFLAVFGPGAFLDVEHVLCHDLFEVRDGGRSVGLSEEAVMVARVVAVVSTRPRLEVEERVIEDEYRNIFGSFFGGGARLVDVCARHPDFFYVTSSKAAEPTRIGLSSGGEMFLSLNSVSERVKEVLPKKEDVVSTEEDSKKDSHSVSLVTLSPASSSPPSQQAAARQQQQGQQRRRRSRLAPNFGMK